MGTPLFFFSFSFHTIMADTANMVTDFKVGTTINQFIAAMERRQPEATGALSVVLMEIAVACKLIASKIRRAGIADVLGKVSSENSTGDVQAKLDVQSNHVMKQRLMSTKYVLAYVSEEKEEVTYADGSSQSAKYVICTDPLDGSSNIDCNVGVGTIFGSGGGSPKWGPPAIPRQTASSLAAPCSPRGTSSTAPLSSLSSPSAAGPASTSLLSTQSWASLSSRRVHD